MGSNDNGNQGTKVAAYSATLVDAGCPHCGHGRQWTISGPTIVFDKDAYVGWSEEMINGEVAHLNEVFNAGRRSTTRTPLQKPN